MKPKTSTNNAINQNGSVFGGNNETIKPANPVLDISSESSLVF